MVRMQKGFRGVFSSGPLKDCYLGFRVLGFWGCFGHVLGLGLHGPPSIVLEVMSLSLRV